LQIHKTTMYVPNIQQLSSLINRTDYEKSDQKVIDKNSTRSLLKDVSAVDILSSDELFLLNQLFPNEQVKNEQGAMYSFFRKKQPLENLGARIDVKG